VTTKITAEEFDKVADAQCSRWDQRTLKIARASLVDGVKDKELARRMSVTPAYVVIVRGRFLKRLTAPAVTVPAAAFMREELPEGATVLKPFRKEVQRLLSNGYSPEQIEKYLAANKVQVSHDTLNAFLKELAS
jgi:hypothetical protein